MDWREAGNGIDWGQRRGRQKRENGPKAGQGARAPEAEDKLPAGYFDKDRVRLLALYSESSPFFFPPFFPVDDEGGEGAECVGRSSGKSI